MKYFCNAYSDESSTGVRFLVRADNADEATTAAKQEAARQSFTAVFVEDERGVPCFDGTI